MRSATNLTCVIGGLFLPVSASADVVRLCDPEIYSWVAATEKYFAGSPYDVDRDEVEEFDYIDFWDVGAAVLFAVAEREPGYETVDAAAVVATDKMIACMQKDIGGSVDPEELKAMSDQLNEMIPLDQRAALVARMQAQ